MSFFYEIRSPDNTVLKRTSGFPDREAATEAGNIPSIAAQGGEIAMEGGLTAAEYASGAAIAKFGWDTLTVAWGYAVACRQ